MWGIALRLVSIGVPLDFTSSLTLEEAKSRIKEYNKERKQQKAKDHSSVKVSINRHQLKASGSRLNLLALPRPVFYAKLTNELDLTRIKGKFNFQVHIRVVFILAMFALLAFEGIWGFRLFNGLQAGDSELAIGVAIMLLPALILQFLFVQLLLRFTRKTAFEISQVTNVLQQLFS